MDGDSVRSDGMMGSSPPPPPPPRTTQTSSDGPNIVGVRRRGERLDPSSPKTSWRSGSGIYGDSVEECCISMTMKEKGDAG